MKKNKRKKFTKKQIERKQLKIEYEKYKKRRLLYKQRGVGLDNQLSFANYKRTRENFQERNEYLGEKHNINIQIVQQEIVTSRSSAKKLASKLKHTEFKRYDEKRIRNLSNMGLHNLIALLIDNGIMTRNEIEEVLY